LETISEQSFGKTNSINTDASGKRSALGRVVFSLSVIAVFTKIFGFAEKLVIAHFFGTDVAADVYFASMGVVLSVVFLVKELIYPSLLPVFAESLPGPRHSSAILFRKIFLLAAVALAIFSLCLAVFSDICAGLIVPGFSDDKKHLTSIMLKLLSPGCFFLSLCTITYTVLNSRRKFLKAAFPEAGLKLFIVAGLIVLVPFIGVYALALVLTLGAATVFLVQLYFVPESRELFKTAAIKAGGEFNKFLKLMGPLVIGVVFSHISGLVDNVLASLLPTGHLSYLGYSKKLINAILLVGPVALVTVVYSQLAHISTLKTKDEFRKLFTRALRFILYVSVPAALLLVALREPFVQILFERGRFTAQSTLGTSNALFVYGIGLVTFSLESLVVYSFYALSNTKVPVKAGILCVFVDIILAVSFVRPFGYMGIAWAFVISKTIKVVILFAVLEKHLGFLYNSKLLGFLSRLAAATILPSFTLHLLCKIENQSSLIRRAVFDLAVPAAGFVSVFIIFSYLLKIRELRELAEFIFHRKTFKYQLAGEKV